MDQGGTPAVDGAEQAANIAVPAAKRFAAFMSYAHVDQAVADRLHKQIETYRLPKKLRAADGGEAAVRLGSVFRDRADLAAADSLSDAIRAALADSGALIVLCSPAAVQSRWVNAEIRLFRELNPGAPVLAAVVRGEPADAMPEALTEGNREPLAADLREEGDGKKLGFLKIVAALAGVPLDALIQRDAQRKLRRVMAVTVGALMALIATATMMTYAIQQRNEARAQRAEAERQRAQANGLVDFMLTDLRERLRGVGRVDIMRAAASTALQNYRQNDSSELPPDSAARLARVLIAVGEDDISRGEIDEADLSFREAHTTTAALLSAEPNEPDRIWAHAQSEFYIGRVAYARGNLVEGRQRFLTYRTLAYRLVTLDPDRARALREVAYAEGNLCTLDQQQQRDALPRCRAALAAMQRVAALPNAEPSVAADVANRHGWLGEELERQNQFNAALEQRRAQIDVASRLRAMEPDNFNYIDVDVTARIALGQTLLRMERNAQALAVLRPVANEARSLVQRDQENSRWQFLAELSARLLGSAINADER